MENKNRSARRALIYGGLYMVAFFGAMTHFAVEYIGSKMNKSQPEQLEKSQPVKMQKKQYENDNSISIQLKGAQLPIYDFCKYMILLNLPGNQPWAYRFREILLMGSLVVNISVYASYDNGKTWNDPWIHFWSCLFNPNEHYVDLEYRWMENNEEYNKKQNQKLFSDLENLNKDILKNREKYSKIAYNGSKKMRQLSMDTIYRYITYIFEKVERFDI